MIFGLLVALTGIIIVIGSLCRWRFFLNPHGHIWFFKIWPDAFMRGSKFNERFFIIYNLIGGILGIIIGIILFLIALRKY